MTAPSTRRVNADIDRYTRILWVCGLGMLVVAVLIFLGWYKVAISIVLGLLALYIWGARQVGSQF